MIEQAELSRRGRLRRGTQLSILARLVPDTVNTNQNIVSRVQARVACAITFASHGHEGAAAVALRTCDREPCRSGARKAQVRRSASAERKAFSEQRRIRA